MKRPRNGQWRAHIMRRMNNGKIIAAGVLLVAKITRVQAIWIEVYCTTAFIELNCLDGTERSDGSVNISLVLSKNRNGAKVGKVIAMNKPTTTARGIFAVIQLNPGASGRPDSKEAMRPEMRWTLISFCDSWLSRSECFSCVRAWTCFRL